MLVCGTWNDEKRQMVVVPIYRNGCTLPTKLKGRKFREELWTPTVEECIRYARHYQQLCANETKLDDELDEDMVIRLNKTAEDERCDVLRNNCVIGSKVQVRWQDEDDRWEYKDATVVDRYVAKKKVVVDKYGIKWYDICPNTTQIEIVWDEDNTHTVTYLYDAKDWIVRMK